MRRLRNGSLSRQAADFVRLRHGRAVPRGARLVIERQDCMACTDLVSAWVEIGRVSDVRVRLCAQCVREAAVLLPALDEAENVEGAAA